MGASHPIWWKGGQAVRPGSPWCCQNAANPVVKPSVLQEQVAALLLENCRHSSFIFMLLTKCVLFPVVSEHSEQGGLHARNIEKSHIPELWTFAQISYKFSQGDWATTSPVVSKQLQLTLTPLLFLFPVLPLRVVPYKQQPWGKLRAGHWLKTSQP